MKACLINTDYVLKHRFQKIWRVLFLSFGGLLVILISIEGFERLIKFDSIIRGFAIFFTSTSFLLIILNSFLFVSVGELIIEDNQLIIDIKEEKKVIDLNTIKEVVFAKEDRKFYYLQIEEEKMIIDLKSIHVSDFKKKLLEHGIKIRHRNFLDRISEFFSIQ